MESVIIAGGAGFIGSHLCRLFLNAGTSVTCIDNLITGDKSNIKDLLENPHFSFIEHDVVHPLDSLESQIKEASAIFHLASPASPNKKSPKSYIQFPIETLLVNGAGTYNLLNLAKKWNAKFLYASTSEIYGDPLVTPQKEDYFGNVNSVGVRSVYDEGKRYGEAMTMAFVRKHNLDARIIRIFNTYGPYMQPDDGRVVSNFIGQAIQNEKITVYGEGDQTRSFCYVSDLIDGIKRAMFTADTKGEVINLGNPDERTVLDLANLIKGMVESTSEIVFEELPQDDPKVRKPDITKAKELLGWQPSVTLEDGLSKTISYFKSL